MRVDYGLCLPNIHSPPSSNKKLMEKILKPTRLDFLFDADQKTAYRDLYTLEQLQEQKEEIEKVGERSLIFTWKGLAKDWKLYSQHLFPDFKEFDERI